MCGICGGIAYSEKGGARLNRIPAAVESMRLRGPDQKGIFVDGDVVLGHTRLSIIDLSDAASQPFSDASGRYTIVFNGEVFNFNELRKPLEQLGIPFRSKSDTEVILHLYILQGPSFLEKLNGFFALCIYDKQENNLFIARDRMGIKPLYIFHDEDNLLFASELKALMALDIPKEIHPGALFTYLQLNYIPAPASIFRKVNKLMPGHYLTVHGSDVRDHQWYSIPCAPAGSSHDDYPAACKRIRELMDRSVQQRLISDVPLGSFLSGGIDSSIITGLAAQHTSSLKTFSIGFQDEPHFDETRYAEEIARLHKTDHQAFRLTTNDLYEALGDVLDYIDEPFADSSALAVYILSRETRKQVTVALSGDGADEVYGGYIKHRAEYRMRSAGMAEQLVRRGQPLWKLLPKSRNSALGNKFRQLDRFAQGMELSPADRYWRWASISDEAQAEALLGCAGSPPANYAALKAECCRDLCHDDLNDVLLADMHLVLVNDMLVKVDLMSMANSLEVRVPFLDYEHVNYVFSLPAAYKFGRDQGKKILRDTFKDLLTDTVLNRPKHGFEVPLLRWFRTDMRRQIHEELLREKFVREQGLFQWPAVNKILQQLDSADPGDAAARIWNLLVFQYWWIKNM